jgi:GINS complex subunit 4
MDWDDEYNRNSISFIDRARNAIDDDDDNNNDQDLFNAPPIAAPAFQQQPDTDETPLEQLTRHWMNERHAPDILPAQELLLSTLLDHIRRQVSTPSFD